MACENCAETESPFQHLIDEGQKFLKQANALCRSCHKLGKCNDCGCGAKFEIKHGQLIKSTCLLEKF